MLTKAQRELRRTGITATEIAVLAGLSRWSSPIAIYEEKVAPPKDDDEATLAMDLGSLLEEPMAKLYARDTGLHLARCHTMRNPAVSALALATLDRVAFEAKRSSRAWIADPAECRDAVKNVEFKTSTWRLRYEWGEPGTDAVPEHYLCQATWQMGVTGLRVTDMPVLFDRDAWCIYTVRFHEELWLGLLEVAERFWCDHVLARVPPPPDASDRYKDFLARAFPGTTGEVVVVQAGDVREGLVKKYATLSTLGRLVDEEKKLVANQLRALIGEAKALQTPIGTVTRSWVKPSMGTDWEALARAVLTPEDLSLKAPLYQREKRPGYWRLLARATPQDFGAEVKELVGIGTAPALTDGADASQE